MKKKVLIFTIALILIPIVIGITRASNFNSNEDISKNTNMTKHTDYVPNQATAIKIAEAIWLPIYGEKVLDQKPYKVHLNEDVWIVTGSLPNGMRGGVAYIEIQKSNCKVLKVSHGK